MHRAHRADPGRALPPNGWRCPARACRRAALPSPGSHPQHLAAIGNTLREGGLEIVFELLIMLTGRIVVCVATLGHCKSESLLSDDYRTHGAAGALWYSRDGRCVVTQSGQSLAGLLFYVGLVLALVLLAQAAG